MDYSKKRKIVKKLAKRNNFTSKLSRSVETRRWFVLKIINYFESQGLSDIDTETETENFIKEAIKIVRAKRNFKIKIGLPSRIRRKEERKKIAITINRKRKDLVIYGALAMHPKFIDPTYSDFLSFIVERRYRGVFRMDYYVNPNYQGYFRYTSACSPTSDFQVNADARSHWDPFDDGGIYFELENPSGTNDPTSAIKKLFKKYRRNDRCDGNLLECARVLTTVLMDTLREAKDENKLLKKIESKRTRNIGILSPITSTNGNFINDITNESVFERLFVPVYDLQIGDHMYIYNHGLYKIFNAGGAWQGEHSLVYRFGNKNYKSSSGYFFGGHGKEGTLYKFYTDFLKELKTNVSRAYKVGKIYLMYRQSGDTSLPSSVMQKGSASIDIEGTSVTYDLYQYNNAFWYKNYKAKKRRAKKTPLKTETGFLIVQSRTTNEFYLVTEKKISDIFGTSVTDPIKFKSTTLSLDASTNYNPVNWEIIYTQEITKADMSIEEIDKRWDLFQEMSGNIRIHQIETLDLFENPFGTFTAGGPETLDVSRPRVNFDASYQTFLKNNGAF